jgi:hypothetical protein
MTGDEAPALQRQSFTTKEWIIKSRITPEPAKDGVKGGKWVHYQKYISPQ